MTTKIKLHSNIYSPTLLKAEKGFDDDDVFNTHTHIYINVHLSPLPIIDWLVLLRFGPFGSNLQKGLFCFRLNWTRTIIHRAAHLQFRGILPLPFPLSLSPHALLYLLSERDIRETSTELQFSANLSVFNELALIFIYLWLIFRSFGIFSHFVNIEKTIWLILIRFWVTFPSSFVVFLKLSLNYFLVFYSILLELLFLSYPLFSFVYYSLSFFYNFYILFP